MNYLDNLKNARLELHKAIQWPSRAARANLSARDDDSQSSLVWQPNLQLLISQELISNRDSIRIGVSFYPFQMEVLINQETNAYLKLSSLSEREVGGWLDGQLHALGLKSASQCDVPYELAEISTANFRKNESTTAGVEFRQLRDLYKNAAKIISEATNNLVKGFIPSPLRCWPHHFDMATLVQIDENDKSIGIGFSPGDEVYNCPYYYVTPWPYPEIASVSQLTYGHWHVDGYFAGILPLETEDVSNSTIRTFLEEAFLISRSALGD